MPFSQVNLAALFVNLAILPFLSGDLYWTWSAFFLLTLLHLFANYRAVKTLHFSTLNRARLLDVLGHFAVTGIVPNPRIVNERESVFIGSGLSDVDVCGAKINVGVSLTSICRSVGDDRIVWAQIEQNVGQKPYAVFESRRGKQYDVLIFDNFQPKDLLKSYIEAFCLAYRSNHSNKISKDFESKMAFDNFEESLIKAGWKTTHLQMNTQGWVGSFKKSS